MSPKSSSSGSPFNLTRSQQRALYSLVALIVLAIIALVAPRDVSAPDVPPTETVAVNPGAGSTPGSVPALPGWLKVYFTNPNPPDDINHGVDQFILPLIEGAKKTIDATSFDLNLPSVINALVDAKARGVQVRVVYDGENGSHEADNPALGDQPFDGLAVLKKAKVPLVDGGRSNGLMHNKMIILDGKTLVMGSWNLSFNDTYRNNNNILVITAPQLIANYQAKFNESFEQKRFGAKAEVGAQTPRMTLDGVAVENYFSPVDNVMDKLVAYVQGAKKSVHFIIFTYTHADLSDAMIARAKAGVDVQGIIENRAASQGAMVPLFCAKLPVKVDGNKYTMHHKVMILDGETVITGSFNFTKAADQSNDDNVLVIHSAAVAALYEQEYQRLLKIAQNPDPADIQCK